MKRAFADTLYRVALVNSRDQWHPAATSVSRTLGGRHPVTTDEVLTEVLAAFCGAGPFLRRLAAALVRGLHRRSTVTVYPSSRETFLRGLTLYEARPDKGYSLTDCIPMETMRREGITDILAHDDHFRQEGFTLLL